MKGSLLLYKDLVDKITTDDKYNKVFFEKLPIPKMIGTPNQQVIESANENINIEKNCLLLFNFSEDEIKEIEKD